MGFPVEASRVALAEYHTVAAAVDAMVNRTGTIVCSITYKYYDVCSRWRW